MKKLNTNQMAAYEGGACDPNILKLFICELRLLPNGRTIGICRSGGVIVTLVCD